MMFSRVESFVKDVGEVTSEDELAEAIGAVTADLGFRYFALAHHADVRRSSQVIRIHNYPAGWAEWFDEQQLGQIDPVHRASHLTSVGFVWSRLPEMISLTPRDQKILAAARKEGIGEGFTVPAHVPGEIHGSCSFATEPGIQLTSDQFPLLQLVGAFAFEAARRVRHVRQPAEPRARLTERQRECLMWAARGKSDWEIARILGVSHETVIRHLKQARERYGVAKRTLLTVHALFDGSLAFPDVLKR
jgi:LuxR family quorum-sensing system transcriptional regulator CciR